MGCSSLIIGGVESIIANDHGRGWQESLSCDRDVFAASTAYNPTGHGSRDDSTGAFTESNILGAWASADGKVLRTRVQGAFWLGQGDVGAAAAVDSTPSQFIFDKTITAGYLGNANTWRIQLDVIVPTRANVQAMTLLVVEATCLYFNTAGPASMTVAEDWDYVTEGLTTIQADNMLPAGPTFRAARPIISNVAGTMCGGIYGIRKSTSNGVLSRAGDYRVTDHNGDGSTIMNPDVQITDDYAGGIAAGTQSYEVLVGLGTKAEVLAAFTVMKAQRPAP